MKQAYVLEVKRSGEGLEFDSVYTSIKTGKAAFHDFVSKAAGFDFIQVRLTARRMNVATHNVVKVIADWDKE